MAASGAYAELQASLPPGCTLMTMEEVCVAAGRTHLLLASLLVDGLKMKDMASRRGMPENESQQAVS